LEFRIERVEDVVCDVGEELRECGATCTGEYYFDGEELFVDYAMMSLDREEGWNREGDYPTTSTTFRQRINWAVPSMRRTRERWKGK